MKRVYFREAENQERRDLYGDHSREGTGKMFRKAYEKTFFPVLCEISLAPPGGGSDRASAETQKLALFTCLLLVKVDSH